MLSGFQGDTANSYAPTPFQNLPSLSLTWFQLILPKILGYRQERDYYFFLRELRLRELNVLSRIPHGFLMKKVKPTFSNSSISALTFFLASDINFKLDSQGGDALGTPTQELILLSWVGLRMDPNYTSDEDKSSLEPDCWSSNSHFGT